MECALCQMVVQDNEEEEWLPCAHVFHRVCCEAWMKTVGQPLAELPCPICKTVPAEADATPLSDAMAGPVFL